MRLKNKFSLFLVLVLLTSCVHSKFKIEKSERTLRQIEVTSDRVGTYCEKVVTDQPGNFTYYVIAIVVRDELDLLNAMYPVYKFDEKGCKKLEEKIAKMLSKNKTIKLGIMSDFTDRVPDLGSNAPIPEKFGKKYRYSKMFSNPTTIWTDVGDCWDIYTGEDGRCPGEDSMFPLK